MIFSDDSVVRLGELSYTQVGELCRWCNQASSVDGSRWREYVTAGQKKAAELAARRSIAATRRGVLVEKFFKKAYQNLAVGTRLKLKGCRDGHGLREFMDWDGENLVCRQVVLHRHYAPVGRTHYSETLGQITTHMYDKVIGVYVGGKLVPLRQYVA